jgi:hypothetical protein
VANKSFNLLYGVLLALSLAACPSLIAAQDEPPPVETRPWRLLLAQQLRAEKTCDLLEVLLFDEFLKDGEKVLEGKISCVDGRKFDFVRRREHMKFELDLCQPAYC